MRKGSWQVMGWGVVQLQRDQLQGEGLHSFDTSGCLWNSQAVTLWRMGTL